MKDLASLRWFLLVAIGSAGSTYVILTVDDPTWRAAVASLAVLNFLFAIWESGKDRS